MQFLLLLPYNRHCRYITPILGECIYSHDAMADATPLKSYATLEFIQLVVLDADRSMYSYASVGQRGKLCPGSVVFLC